MIDLLGFRLLRLASRFWIPVLLLVGLVSTVVSSVDSANWVEEDRLVLGSLFIAVAMGGLLALSRFRGLFVLLYSLLLGLAASLQVVGNLLPPRALLSQGLWVWVDELNLRAVRLSLRAGSWIETVQAGENVEDPGLFIVLLSLVVWAAVLWLMWFMLRKRQVLLGLLPLGFLLAVNVNLSRQPLGVYFVFLMFAFLLVAREAFLLRHQTWEARRVDYPEQLGVEWSLSAVAVVLVVLMVARVAPLVSTPEGWRALSEWARSLNQQTAETAEQLFSAVNTPPPPPAGQKPVIYATTPNLSEIGSPLPQGNDTIMWVKTSDPAPMMEEYGIPIPDLKVKGHYWRSGIFDVYTGRGWQPAELSEGAAAPALEAAPGKTASPGRYYMRQEYEIAARHRGRLFSVNEPVPGGQGLSSLQTADGSRVLEGRGSRYAVISAATRVTGDELAAAGAEYPPAVRDAYLRLPDTLPDRVETLARRITAGAADPYHAALAIQNYLRVNYPYQENTPPPPAGRDVVDYFLFERPEGFCSHYASAMVVMLRTQGVPARVATGYATGSWDSGRGAYRVMPSSAHAWVEVFFPGYGWVEFEPTASQEPFAYLETNPMGGTATGLQAPVAPPVQSPSFLLPLLAVLALAALAMPFVLLRVFRASRGDPVQQVDSLYRQMRLALSWAGLPSAGSVTPDEYLARTRLHLAPYERIQRALRRATDLYRQSVFSPHPPGAVDARIASDLWKNAVGEWVVLWLKERWKRIKQRA